MDIYKELNEIACQLDRYASINREDMPANTTWLQIKPYIRNHTAYLSKAVRILRPGMGLGRGVTWIPHPLSDDNGRTLIVKWKIPPGVDFKNDEELFVVIRITYSPGIDLYTLTRQFYRGFNMVSVTGVKGIYNDALEEPSSLFGHQLNAELEKILPPNPRVGG